MPSKKLSPKLPQGTLLLFVALGFNIITSIVGVAAPQNLLARQVVYVLLLVIVLFLFLFILHLKHAFLACTWNVKPWFATKCPVKGRKAYCLRSCYCSWSMIHDTVLCLMALLYLFGDNLEMACTCDNKHCHAVGRFVTGISLMLNIFLTLLKVPDVKLNLPSAYPVIGTMGDVYEKMLGIAAQALTIDQGVTTVLEAIDMVDDNHKAIKIFAALGAIVACLVLFALALAAPETKGLFSKWVCKEIIMTQSLKKLCCNLRNELVRKFKSVKWRNLGHELLCSFFVMAFVILFMLGDIDWIYSFYCKDTVSHPANIVRLTALCASFVILCILSLVYHILCVCLPGVCFVWKEKKFFLPKHDGVKVNGRMMRKQHNEWDRCTHVQEGEKECNLKGKINVEDQFGESAITFSVNEIEEVTCCDGLLSWIDWKQDRLADTDPHAGTNWTAQVRIHTGNTDETNVGNGQGEDAGGTSGPSSNGAGIEVPLPGTEGSSHDTSVQYPQ